MKYKYEEGQKVFYNLGNGLSGWGVVRGCSTIISKEYPIWIVQFSHDNKIEKTSYPFSAWLFFDNQLGTEEFEITVPSDETNNESDTKSESQIK